MTAFGVCLVCDQRVPLFDNGGTQPHSPRPMPTTGVGAVYCEGSVPATKEEQT